MGKNKDKITFEYIKSSDFKIYPVSGGIGGLNAQGDIVVSLYHERTAIPKKATYELLSNGQLNNKTVKIEGKSNIIRDVFMGIALKPDGARNLAQWLNDQADILEERIKKGTNE